MRRLPILLACATVVFPLVGAGCASKEVAGSDGATSGGVISAPSSAGSSESGAGSPAGSATGSGGPSSTSAAPATGDAVGTVPGVGTTTTTELPLPPAASALKIADNRVFILADSVLLGAKAEIPVALKGWKPTVDAAESRFITQGQAVLASKQAAIDRQNTDEWDEAKGTAETAGRPAPPEPKKVTLAEAVGEVVVVSLCTNFEAGGNFGSWIDKYMVTLKNAARVVWVTCAEWSKGQTEANEAIRASVAKHKTIVVADWALYAGKPGYTYADKIHLDGAGRKAAAELLALAVGPAPKSK